MLLKTQDLTMQFGGLTAVNMVNMDVEEGEIRGLIGPNGSGKTTLINMISNFYMPSSGKIMFKGDDITKGKAHYATFKGVARTFQNIRIFPDFTVYENVLVSRHSRLSTTLLKLFFTPLSVAREEEDAKTKSLEALETVGLIDYRNQLAKNLSYGMRRLLEIARTIAIEPDLILLDEPGAGMTSDEKNNLLKLITDLNKNFKKTIIIIEHDMKLVMPICDTVSVLNFGEKISEGSPSKVQNDPKVIEAYLGKRGAKDATSS